MSIRDSEMVEKERIVTGTLEGIPFKCKIDSLNLSGGYFIDLKTMESLQSEKYSTTLHRYTKSLLYNIVEYQYTLQKMCIRDRSLFLLGGLETERISFQV